MHWTKKQFSSWPKLRSPKLPKGKWNPLLIGLGGVAFLGGCATLLAFLLNSAMSCGGKAMQVIPKTTLGAMNRAQQASFAEQSKFASTFADLKLDTPSQNTNYEYSTRATPTAAFNYAIARREYTTRTQNFLMFEWQERGIDLNSYVGAAFVISTKTLAPVAQTTPPTKRPAEALTVVTIRCEALAIGSTRPADPSIDTHGKLSCGAGTKQLN